MLPNQMPYLLWATTNFNNFVKPLNEKISQNVRLCGIPSNCNLFFDLDSERHLKIFYKSNKDSKFRWDFEIALKALWIHRLALLVGQE